MNRGTAPEPRTPSGALPASERTQAPLSTRVRVGATFWIRQRSALPHAEKPGPASGLPLRTLSRPFAIWPPPPRPSSLVPQSSHTRRCHCSLTGSSQGPQHARPCAPSRVPPALARFPPNTVCSSWLSGLTSRMEPAPSTETSLPSLLPSPPQPPLPWSPGLLSRVLLPALAPLSPSPNPFPSQHPPTWPPAGAVSWLCPQPRFSPPHTGSWVTSPTSVASMTPKSCLQLKSLLSSQASMWTAPEPRGPCVQISVYVPFKPFCDGTAIQPECRASAEAPSSLSQPHTSWLRPPDPHPELPPGPSHQAALLLVPARGLSAVSSVPSDPPSTQQPEGSFRRTNVIQSHSCLKTSVAYPAFGSSSTPELSPKALRDRAQGPPHSLPVTTCNQCRAF